MKPLHTLALLVISVAQAAQAPAVSSTTERLVRDVRAAAKPITDDAASFDPLVRLAGGARFVLIGESTHGTHEFYRARAEITKRLITEHGFDAVVIEGDWPDAQRVNRYVRGGSGSATPEEALSGFTRFPTWMWANTIVRDFVRWTREHNNRLPPDVRVGFYGMDVYSLAPSRAAVIRALEQLDPAAARAARERYACFTRAGEDLEAYMLTLVRGQVKSCQEEVNAQHANVVRLTTALRARPGVDREALLDLEQNALVVKNAEAYARTEIEGRESSWNVRDRHMFATLEGIRAHLGRDAKIVVWAHNSHVGDARATEAARRGELTVGQLVREAHGRQAVLVGMTTHEGTVTAARSWDEPPQLRRVQPSLPDSYERVFHETGLPAFMLLLRDAPPRGLSAERLERAIGVIYRPETERLSHYFTVNLAGQFDAVLHYDQTRALQPLNPPPGWSR